MRPADKDSPAARTGLEIAIVGMSGRFPGAGNLKEFWHNLKHGVESLSLFSDEELAAAGVDEALYTHPDYVPAKGLLEDGDCFDGSLFGYLPGESAMMDPQMRVFHECVWAALEDAGYDPSRYGGSIGLYGGASSNLYWEAQAMATRLDGGTEQFSAQHVVDKDFLCTQISHKLGLRGPSVLVQTACSTSLVAVHTACRALLTGECDLAVAGGVTVSLPRRQGHLYLDGLILSKEPHCRAFDAEASGIVGGEGVGAVVLKTLKRAEADRDNIHAILKGSAVNNDGARRVGFAAPGPDGQAEVIAAALRVARVDPASISYIETHGTGTRLGDPIEIEGLRRGFAAVGPPPSAGSCRIGSVKTNVGHLDTAAGIVSLLKTVLSLKHRQIPPSLHFRRANPDLGLDGSPFVVNSELTPWQGERGARRAGVSSFGTGGTNVHVLLEEAPERPASSTPPDRVCLLPLAAGSAEALRQSADRLGAFLETHPELELQDVAYTLQVGRRPLPHRRVLVAGSTAEAITALADPRAGTEALRETLDPSPVIFMFPGQGSQYLHMGRDLYLREPLFRAEVDRSFAILDSLGAGHVAKTLWPETDGVPSSVDATDVAQCGLFTLEYALAKLLIAWGISPAGMIGHSVGEYVAACLAGVLSLEDALGLMVLRGRLMQSLPGGGMWSVAASEDEVIPLLSPPAEVDGEVGEGVVLAAVNAPERCVVSGTEEAIEAFAQRLEEAGISGRPLKTSHAFHSPMMDSILRSFREAVSRLDLAPPQEAYISTLTGNWVDPGEVVGPDYWVRHLRHTVRFGDGIKTLLKQFSTPEVPAVFVEVGPGTTLSTFSRAVAGSQGISLRLLRHARQDTPDRRLLLEGIGRLWLAGVEVDWLALHGDAERHRISLPTYPFERHRLPDPGDPLRLLQNGTRPQGQGRGEALDEVGGREDDIADWFYVPAWRRTPQPMAPIAPRHVLVFQGRRRLGKELIQRLQQAGHRVTAVRMGEEFTRLDARTFTLDPQTSADYDQLLASLPEEDGPVAAVFHLWAVTDPSQSAARWDRLTEVETRGFYSLCFLANSLAERWPGEKIRLLAVTANMEAVTGGDLLHPEQALVLGPCGVIGKEYADIDCRSVDLDLRTDDGDGLRSLAECLLLELDSDLSTRRVAYRGPYRWTHDVEPQRLPTPAASHPTLRSGGVYLITGGLGGIGLALAESLARDFKAKLILVGRSPFPAKEDWEEWLTDHPEDDPTGLKIQRLLAMECQGAEVLVTVGDVSKHSDMEKSLAKTLECFGALHGVVHSAGVPDGGILRLRSQALSERVFAPKLAGTLVLQELLAQIELDFFLLCSSLASCLTDMGDVAYSSANAFLDALAQMHGPTLPPGRTLSLGWEGWREVGMAVTTTKKLAQDLGLADYRSLIEAEGLTSPEGVEVFYRVLACSLPHVMVSTVGLRQRLAASGEGAPLLERLQGNPPSANPDTLPAPAVTLTSAEQVLSEQFERVLGLESIDPEADFFDIGVDSLGLVRVYREINTCFPNQLAVQDLFDNRSIRALARLLANETPAAEPEAAEPRRIEF